MLPLLVVVGETASGKSALAMKLAQQYNGELICADSWTVYRGFDIGTAKPPLEDQALIKHHVLDVADPAVGFNAVEFQRLAQAAIADISSRGKLPIVVGGTGLYVDCLLYDYGFLAATDPQLRAELNSKSLEELVAQAEQFDTTDIDLRNKRRVIRLIENQGQRPTKQALRESTLILGLRRPAAELEQRITKRVQAMLAAGLIDEVRQLGERYGWDCEPMRSACYRLYGAYVRGELSLDEAQQKLCQSDKRLAKKQRTWFKRNSSIQWINTPVNYVHVDELVTTLLNN